MMEKSELTLSLDSERMCALAFYLAKEDSTVQSKMEEALGLLYERTVPEAVREYLDAKVVSASRPKRPPRPSRSKTAVPGPAAAPVNDGREDSV